MPMPGDQMRMPGVDDQLKKMFDPNEFEKVEKERDQLKEEVSRLRDVIDELQDKIDWYEKKSEETAS